jgi:hypothetical protein
LCENDISSYEAAERNKAMSDQDAARQQAQNDVNQNKGPAQTHTWDSAKREAYEAEYNRLKNQK